MRHPRPHPRHHVGPRWPTTPGAYDYLLALHILDCAWEFLRRNAQYQDESNLHRSPPRHAAAHPAVSRCNEQHGDASQLRHAASVAFVDPRKAAPQASVVWMSPIIDTEVDATTDLLQNRGPVDFCLARLPPISHLAIDAGGNQHFVLKSPDDHATLHITGALAPAGPVRIKFESLGVDALPSYRDALRVLTSLLHSNQAPATSPEDWPAERRELRDSLIAIDGKCAGATHREIATVPFPHDHINGRTMR